MKKTLRGLLCVSAISFGFFISDPVKSHDSPNRHRHPTNLEGANLRGANLRWANNLHPENIYIQERLHEVIKKRKKGLSTLPSTLKEEMRTNLFLRARNVDEFTKLRLHKDNWKE